MSKRVATQRAEALPIEASAETGKPPRIQRVGFACMGDVLPWTTGHAFRLASFSEERLFATIEENLNDLQSLLTWMEPRGLRLFRLGSSIIPFASHEVMNVDWQSRFAPRLAELGERFSAAGFRLSMHPGQYTILNSPNPVVVERALGELSYAVGLLDMMGLDDSHKVVIHGGGIYGDRDVSTARLLAALDALPMPIRRRLVLENDERLFNLKQITLVSEASGIPAVFDLHHHQINPCEDMSGWLARLGGVWDCTPKVHLSSQKLDARPGAHDYRIRREDLDAMCAALPFDADLMIEAKGKEVAALEVLDWLHDRPSANPSGAHEISNGRRRKGSAKAKERSE